MRRVFLDANILFSAANPQTNLARLIDRLFSVCPVVTSTVAYGEADRNLQTKWPQHHAGLAPLVERLEVVQTALFPLPVTLADKDQPILCAAISANCDLLLTGDLKDFGHLVGQTVEGVEVIDPVGMARRIRQQMEEKKGPRER